MCSSSYGKSLTAFLTADAKEISLTTQIMFLTGVALLTFGPCYILAKTVTKAEEVKKVVEQVQYVEPKADIVTEKPSKVEFAKYILEEKEWKKMKPFHVKVKGITFKVKGNKKDYRYWQVACEHTEFRDLCINCANNVLKEFKRIQLG